MLSCDLSLIVHLKSPGFTFYYNEFDTFVVVSKAL